MHPTVIEFVGNFLDNKNHHADPRGLAVLEVGSQDFNGTVKPLFVDRGCASYVGVDMSAGKGVDVVAPASALPFDPCSFDIVVSTEMLEHDATFWLSLAEMRRVLKPGGLLILTARGFNEKNQMMWYHGYPHDYFRFGPGSFEKILAATGFESISVATDRYPGHIGWFGTARKPANG